VFCSRRPAACLPASFASVGGRLVQLSCPTRLPAWAEPGIVPARWGNAVQRGEVWWAQVDESCPGGYSCPARRAISRADYSRWLPGTTVIDANAVEVKSRS